ncbi:MAG: glycoside hydrolase family 3 C-terminal domain-containing protein, partial [Muriicola sp.]|nr:glycoside hydrolase family 3 C-terminal domain-containing protein [Muriicola sp.]
LGLFDDPYVDLEKASKIAGKPEFRRKGRIAQGKSTVLLKNDNILPLKKGTKIYVEGMYDTEALSSYGEVVSNPKDADVIVKRLRTPFDERTDSFIEKFFHQGRLYYNEEEMKDIMNVISKKPSVVIVNLERPAILKEINNASSALMVEFGAEDVVVADLLFGKKQPMGKMPFDLPSTWEAVLNQKEDMPFDTKDPLYSFGDGLRY